MRGIIYFNHGTKHLARLVASLWSLRHVARQDWPVTILDTGESGGIVERIASDGRLRATVQHFDMEKRRRNSCYVAKASLWRHSPYSTTLLLDADTLPVGPLESLFIMAEDERVKVVVTRFADWVTTGPIIRSRVERWRHVIASGGIDVERLVNLNVHHCCPAINTGVVAWVERGQAVLREWESLSRAGWKCPFTDELAMQLLVRVHAHCLAGDEWNCSPIYGTAHGRANVKIWHAHGAKHLGRADGRGGQGHALWFPVFAELWRGNVARIRDWAPAGDDALANNLEALAARTSAA